MYWRCMCPKYIHVCRQTTSFIEISIEAGILLRGNGVLPAMLVACTRVCLQFNQVLLYLSLLPSFSPYTLPTFLSYYTLYTHFQLPTSPISRSEKSLFSSQVDGVALLSPCQVLRLRRGSSRLQRVHSASGWSSVTCRCSLMGR